MVKKNVKSVIQQELKQATKGYLWSTIKFSLVFLLLLFLGLAIYSSQAISPLYFHFITDSKEASVEMLKSIRILPQFDNVLSIERSNFGPSIDNLVFGEEHQRSSTIERLETVLQKNPNAKDVLYGLYLLYKEKGDTDKAQIYLEKAKFLDPRIHN